MFKGSGWLVLSLVSESVSQDWPCSPLSPVDEASSGVPVHPQSQSIYWLQVRGEPGTPQSLKLPLASLSRAEKLW